MLNTKNDDSYVHKPFKSYNYSKSTYNPKTTSKYTKSYKEEKYEDSNSDEDSYDYKKQKKKSY